MKIRINNMCEFQDYIEEEVKDLVINHSNIRFITCELGLTGFIIIELRTYKPEFISNEWVGFRPKYEELFMWKHVDPVARFELNFEPDWEDCLFEVEQR